MDGPRFPRKPYDEVESVFIREKIRPGDYDGLKRRRYVNALIDLKQFIVEGVNPFACSRRHSRRQNRYPLPFDVIWPKPDEGPTLGELMGDEAWVLPTVPEDEGRQHRPRPYEVLRNEVASEEGL